MDSEEINSVAICDGSYQYIDWTNEFFLNCMTFKRKQAHHQRANGKGKKPFQSQLSIALKKIVISKVKKEFY